MKEKLAGKTSFPYKPRKGQIEALKFIKKHAKENVCIDAPTGFGKTAVILSALLPIAPIVWAVRTGNEADRPIEELKEINKRLNTDYFGFSFRGKKDMCLLAREKGLDDTESVAYLCKRSRDNCPYYIPIESLRFKPSEPMLYTEILKLCRENGICPYYFQRELLFHADVVSLSYNYIVHPSLGWVIKSVIPFEDCFLVVDEAHNLRYAGSIFSDEITLNTARNALKEVEKLDKEVAKEVEGILLLMEELRKDMEKKGEEERKVDIQEFYSDYLNVMKKLGEEIRRRKFEDGKAPRSSLYRLATFLIESMNFDGIKGVVFIAKAESDNLRLERWDMRCGEILKKRWRQFKGCIFCSGTLKPIKAFAEMVGIESYAGRHFSTELGRNECLIVRGVSTRGESLTEKQKKKYGILIDEFMKIEANSAIFSASYRIQRELMPYIVNAAKEAGKEIFVEKQGMSGDEGRKLLDEFKKKGGVLVATMTGRFAEGADFPGKELEAMLLIGIPFDRMTLRTQLYIDYYMDVFGEEKGWYYAYVIPAMQRTCQAMGRALRGKEDRALFVLGDERYRERIYSRLLPEYVKPKSVDFEEVGEEMQKSWHLLRI